MQYTMPVSTPRLYRREVKIAMRRSISTLAVAAILSNLVFTGLQIPGGSVFAQGDTDDNSTSNGSSYYQSQLNQWSDKTPTNWQNGNLNQSNSLYQEGESVPFRLILTKLKVDSQYTIRVRYDATKSGINAYDYLTTFDRSRTPSPIPSGTPQTKSIPTDPALSFTQVPGNWSLWGGTFVGNVAGPTTNGAEKFYELQLHATDSTMTLMWGGHLASAVDWGNGFGAASINGSPFHMAISRMIDGRETSSQDRSIKLTEQTTSTSCQLELVKSVNYASTKTGDVLTYTLQYKNVGTANCTGGGVRIDDLVPTGTRYNGSHTEQVQNDANHDGIRFGYQHSNFDLPANDNIQPGASRVSWNANTVVPDESGTVTFEVQVLDMPACTSQDISNTAKIFSNQTYPPAISSKTVTTKVTSPCTSSLKVIKHVVGGTATAADFTMHIGQAVSFAGSESGTTKDVTPATYTISETGGPAGYTTSFSGDCNTNGEVTVVQGQQKTCTVTNTKSTTPTNPPLGQSCGLDIGLVIDRSGSVDESEMTKEKTALSNFVNAFTGTPTVFSLTSFATDSTLNKNFSLTPAQAAAAITSDIPNSGDGQTNWDSGLARSNASFDPRPAKADLIVITTDGSPNRRGYPTAVSESQNWTAGLTAAVDRANAIKTAGKRIVVVGIGEDTTDPATPAEKLDKMKAISGPNVATTPGAITTSTDVIKITNFDGIGESLSAFAKELCGGKILVQKQFDTNGDGTADVTGSIPDALLAGWNFDVNGTPSDPTPQTTTSTGSLSFDVSNGTYSVVEKDLKSETRLASAQCTNGSDQVGTVDLQTRTISNLTMGTDDTISCTFVNSIIPNPTITLDKQGPATVAAGGTITYNLVWAVHGNTGVTNAVIADPIPANTSFVSADNGGTNNNGTVSWNLGSKNPGDHGIVNVVVESFSPLVNGTVMTNTACFDTEQTDKVCDTTTTTVTSAPTISLDKQGPATVSAGGTITYNLVWSVSGNATATAAIITDPLPTNTSYVSADKDGSSTAGIVTWNLGSKNPGDHGTVIVVVKTGTPLANGTVITNTACFDTDQTEKVCDPTTTTVQSGPAISIVKTNNLTTFTNPGKTVTYTVTVTNAPGATDTAKALIITDVLPAEFIYVIGGGSTKPFAIGDLTPGKSATITYDAAIGTSVIAGTYTNTAKVTGNNVSELKATSKVEVRVPETLGVTTEPKLKITKTVDHATAVRGDVLLYTITVKNIGDAIAQNVLVKDTLPKGFTTASGGKTSASWTLPTLAVGQAKVLTLKVKVGNTVKAGKVINTVTASSKDTATVKAQVKVTVKVPKVLGLAVTGAGQADYAKIVLGSILLFTGVLLVIRNRRINEIV